MRSESERRNPLEGAELVIKCDKLWTTTIDVDDDDDNDVLMIAVVVVVAIVGWWWIVMIYEKDDDDDNNYEDDSSRSDGRRLSREARFTILSEFASRVTPTRIAKRRVILLWPKIALSTGLGVRFALQT